MDIELLALTLGAFFFSALLKGMTGLGFATVCLGTLACFVDIKVAIPLVILPSLASNVLVMADSGRLKDAARRFWPMYLCMSGGMLLGLWLLGTTPSSAARSVLGTVMALYGAWALLTPNYTIPESRRQLLSLPTGIATGIINGLTGSQVMPALPYLLSIDIDRNMVIAAINLSFTIGSLIMLAGLGRMGLLSMHTVWMALAGIPLVFAGIRLGSLARRRISEAFFRRMVLMLLIVMGLNLVLRG